MAKPYLVWRKGLVQIVAEQLCLCAHAKRTNTPGFAFGTLGNVQNPLWPLARHGLGICGHASQPEPDTAADVYKVAAPFGLQLAPTKP